MNLKMVAGVERGVLEVDINNETVMLEFDIDDTGVEITNIEDLEAIIHENLVELEMKEEVEIWFEPWEEWV